MEDLSGDTNFITSHETFYQGGDSGAPSFVVVGADLQVAGIHTYIAYNVLSTNSSNVIEFSTPEVSINADTTRRISYDNFVPNYRSEILAITAVPEPSSFLGLLLLLCTALRLRVPPLLPLSIASSDFAVWFWGVSCRSCFRRTALCLEAIPECRQELGRSTRRTQTHSTSVEA